MPSTQTAEFVGARSHYITLKIHQNTSYKEEVFLSFTTKWRGEVAEVQLRADRYETSGVNESYVTPWRVTVSQAKTPDERENGSVVKFGKELSGVARQRLRDALLAQAMEWLGSDDYQVSRQSSIAHAIKRFAYDARPYNDPTRDMRAALKNYGDELPRDTRNHLTALADAYDEFARLYNEEVTA